MREAQEGVERLRGFQDRVRRDKTAAAQKSLGILVLGRQLLERGGRETRKFVPIEGEKQVS